MVEKREKKPVPEFELEERFLRCVRPSVRRSERMQKDGRTPVGMTGCFVGVRRVVG